MAKPARWLKGSLVGTCVGRPHRKVGGTGLARWYQLRLVEAVVTRWEPVAGPPGGEPEGPAPFCQASLRDLRLKARTPGGGDEALDVRELSVWDWSVRDQREAHGESRCTLVGTVYAQEVPGTRRPALGEDADRLGRGGCLGLLAALLVASWLWWHCGPFTCGLWTTVVATSWWSHRARTRRRTPPSPLSGVLQSVLGFMLIVGGVALAVLLGDAANAGSCTDVTVFWALAGVAVVVAASLLTIRWHLPWTWSAFGAVMVLWCGRTGVDCAGLWVEQGQRALFQRGPPEKASLLDEARQRVFGPPAGDGERPGPPGAAPGASADGGRGEERRGAAPGGAAHGGDGRGGDELGGDGRGGDERGGDERGGDGPGGDGRGGNGGGGDGRRGDAVDGTGRGADGRGAQARGGDGRGGDARGDVPRALGEGELVGRDGAAGDTQGSEGRADDRGGSGRGTPREPRGLDEGLEAASEPRMSVEAALRDPRPFFDGSTRLTLSGDLLFAFDEDRLRPEADARLSQVAKLLRADPRLRVLLEGHADTIGGEQYNQALSERRAQAVRRWLIDRAHLSPLQIDTVGYGNSKPVVPLSKGPGAQAPNRRVELKIISPAPLGQPD
jgi:outer membrane protein OmpA-like peptidoglycan-associated protein